MGGFQNKLGLIALSGVLVAPALAFGDDTGASKRRALVNEAVADAIEAKEKAQTRKATEAPEPPPVYKPPHRGEMRQRVGGGSRTSGDWPTPLVLSPEHVAETVSASPSLFWFVETAPPDGATVVLTIQDDESIEPLAEVELPVPERAGIQRVRLEEHGIELKVEVEYEWSISLVRDRAKPSMSDKTASAYIRRVAPPSELQIRSAHSYAELGLWYDSLSEVSDGVDANPADSTAREIRNGLLRQAGLDEAAEAPGVAAPAR